MSITYGEVPDSIPAAISSMSPTGLLFSQAPGQALVQSCWAAWCATDAEHIADQQQAECAGAAGAPLEQIISLNSSRLSVRERAVQVCVEERAGGQAWAGRVGCSARIRRLQRHDNAIWPPTLKVLAQGAAACHCPTLTRHCIRGMRCLQSSLLWVPLLHSSCPSQSARVKCHLQLGVAHVHPGLITGGVANRKH